MKLTDKVYVLDSTKGSYVYLLDGAEKMLVDTGLSLRGRHIVKELSSLGVALQEIRHILLTHYDLDHIGNVADLAEKTGASVWASETERPYILGEKDRPGFKKHLAKVMPVRKPESVKAFPQDGKFGEITVIPSPGHTPGHVCLLFDGVLFAGDLVENKKGVIKAYPAFWNWDTGRLAQSIREVEKFEFQWIAPAHGVPVKRSFMTHTSAAGTP